jgi:hypothetical protein
MQPQPARPEDRRRRAEPVLAWNAPGLRSEAFPEDLPPVLPPRPLAPRWRGRSLGMLPLVAVACVALLLR